MLRDRRETLVCVTEVLPTAAAAAIAGPVPKRVWTDVLALAGGTPTAPVRPAAVGELSHLPSSAAANVTGTSGPGGRCPQSASNPMAVDSTGMTGWMGKRGIRAHAQGGDV